LGRSGANGGLADWIHNALGEACLWVGYPRG